MNSNVTDSDAIDPEIREQLIEPFVAATCSAMGEWGKTYVNVTQVTKNSHGQPFGELAAILQLKSGNEGCIVLGLSSTTAVELAKRVFEGALETVDEDLIKDCVGEMGNVISGQAKAILLGTPYHFSFSTPVVVTGDAPELDKLRRQEGFRILFESDLGEIAVDLFIKR